MTQEQYYWFIRRQQLLRAYSQLSHGAGTSASKFIRTSCKYLFEFSSDGKYDPEQVSRDLAAEMKYDPQKTQFLAHFGCSSVRKGSFHGRNYDWYFNRAPEFVVRTPACKDKSGKQKHASIGIANIMDIEADTVIANPDAEELANIECATVDGMNDSGVVCNINVVTAGDSPDYRICDDQPAPGTPVEKALNITYDTAPGKPQMFVGLIVRLVLDYCGKADDVIQLLDQYSWYAARKDGFKLQEELHVMVSDENKTLIIEFIDNSAVVHEWRSDGQYMGVVKGDQKYSIGSADCSPVMTNFYVSRWNGDVESLDMHLPKELRNDTVTEYGQGYERYKQICSQLSSGVDVESIMKNAWYRDMYRSEPEDQKWPSEFLGTDGTFDFNFMSDISSVYEKLRNAKRICLDEDEADRNGFRTPNISSLTWQTMHTSVYDIENHRMTLMTQENPELRQYQL